MGGSLHRKVADRTDDHGGWGAGRANPWYTSGRCGQPRAGQSVPALCVRSVDDTDTPGTSVVPVCGRWAGALPDRAGGTGRYGRASGPAGAMPPGDASDKDQDRLLQGWQPQGKLCQPGLRLPGIWLSATAGEEFPAGSLFWSFTPAVSQAALTAMRETIRKTNLRNRTQITLEDVANEINPLLRGWIEYYGRYCPSALYPVFRHVNRTLVAWAMRKYKRLAGHRTRASTFLETISRENPRLL